MCIWPFKKRKKKMELDGARVENFFIHLEGVATFFNDHLQVSPVPGCWESSSY